MRRGAARLAAALDDTPPLRVVARHTNMVFLEVPPAHQDALRAHLDAAGIRASIGYTPAIRLVTHLDVDDAAIDRTIAALRAFAAGATP